MPAIREISFVNGIRIEGDGIPSVNIAVSQFPSIGALANRQAALNRLLQEYYEVEELLSSYPPDDPVRAAILNSNQRIQKISGQDYVITTLMYIKVIIYSLSPLKYNIRCSDLPIPGTEVF